MLDLLVQRSPQDFCYLRYRWNTEMLTDGQVAEALAMICALNKLKLINYLTRRYILAHFGAGGAFLNKSGRTRI